MPKIINRGVLQKVRESCHKALNSEKRKILICAGSGCIAAGSLLLYERLSDIIKIENINCSLELNEKSFDSGTVAVKKCGCIGLCCQGVLVSVEPEGWLYVNVTPSDAEEIIENTIKFGIPIERLLFREKTSDGSYGGGYSGNYGGSSGGSILKKKDILFYKKQTRSILNYCGKIDAESIKEYFAVGGYSAFEKALFDIQSEDICKEIWYSKLRGRGGAGFPVGYKWMNVLKEEASPKYVLCNGNEGSPGAFADMALMEGVPHQIIEGMLIAAKAVGAMQGYIYIRENYHCAFDRLSIAVKQAEDYCLLGNNILGTGFNFNITLCRGADYFICGESSALIASLSPEGKRAVPSAKRYHISQRGIYEKPTLLNNAETFANVPLIINNSADWYRETGYENSTGTKLLTLTGDVVNSGLIEVNMGANLLDVIYDIGGGISNNRDIKAVQVGGPLSPFLAFEDLDIPIDFDSLTSVGASMGSGSIVVTDISHCIVELSRFFMHFMQKESCGKCTPCREGTLHIFKILKRITEGKGKEGDIEIIEEIADTVINTSLCGFGKSASNVLMSALKYFRDEFDDHVYNHKCVTGVCKIQDA